jgi:hypothetical protein
LRKSFFQFFNFENHLSNKINQSRISIHGMMIISSNADTTAVGGGGGAVSGYQHVADSGAGIAVANSTGNDKNRHKSIYL